ncbi:ATP/GTP phosphatase [termite gut metagenome]|uniref:ATP/GTP phosphatase n=1 Tax=termite gut metagenome TaxID=433724 RepID=A0A5J4R1W0_9ZZZZ
MITLDSIKIENFRGFDSLEIKGLSKINLFVGKNNSGKTSILESIFLLLGMSNPILPSNVNKIRGLGIGTQLGLSKQLKYLFHNLNLNNKPSFHSKFSDTSERKLELEVKFKHNEFSNENSSISVPEINGIELNFEIKKKQVPKKSFKSSLIFENDDKVIAPSIPKNYIENLYATFIPADVKDNNNALLRYSEIIKRKGGDSILKAIQVFDDNIISIQPLNDGIYFNVKNIEELIVSNVMGDGIRRFLTIITAVTEKQDAFVCIDEIENGLHYSAYKLLWKNLLSFIDQNDVQLFIATHNIETLGSLKSVLEETDFENMQDFAKVFTVAKTEKVGFQVYKYSFKEFQTAIDNDIEIRK